MEWMVPIIATVITAATPLVFAALGELITEKAGVLNLGVEGMMIIGAIIGFAVVDGSGSAILGFIGAGLGGMVAASIFAVIVLGLRAEQVPVGLALTLFCLGVSALIGSNYVGIAHQGLPVGIPLLVDLPVIGKLLFGYDPVVYISLLMVFVIQWFLTKSKYGLVLRAVGENHIAAHALGYRVIVVRFVAILFGGVMAGIGGAYLSIAYTPLWAENMTAGRGWIALALVVFASWRPKRVFLGAYIFGGFTILQLHLQGIGIGIPAQYMSMMPYLVTIIVLVWASRKPLIDRLDAPACLGKPFFAS